MENYEKLASVSKCRRWWSRLRTVMGASSRFDGVVKLIIG